MDVSARSTLLRDKPQVGYVGHQFSIAPGRPLLHRFLSLSQTSAGNGVSTLHDHPPSSVHFSCSTVPHGFLPPRPQDAEASVRRGCQGRSASGPPEGLGLESIEHDGTLAQLGSLHGLGRWRRHFPDLEVATVMQYTPGDARELVGKRDRQHVVVEPLGGRLDPGFEAVALPAGRPQQHDAGGLHKEGRPIPGTVINRSQPAS